MKSESKKKRVPVPVEDAETVNLTRLEDLDAALSIDRSIVPSREANSARVRVNKTYKMFVGGAFVRSESGRYFQVRTSSGDTPDPETVNVPLGSRKDGRDAVLAAKNAWDGWAADLLPRRAAAILSRHLGAARRGEDGH